MDNVHDAATTRQPRDLVRTGAGVVVGLVFGVASLYAAIIGNVALLTDESVADAALWFCVALGLGLTGMTLARSIATRAVRSRWLLVGAAPAVLVIAWSLIAFVSKQ